MSDSIIYTLVSKGGGVDGLDHTDKGGQITDACFTRAAAEKHPNGPWCTIVPIVVDLQDVAAKARARLSPVERLALEEDAANKLLYSPQRTR